MRFGCCTSIDNVQQVIQAGYDYIELPGASLKAEQPESEFMPLARQMDSLPIRAEAFNVFLVPGISVAGPNVDLQRLQNYVATSMARARQIGGRIIVFGSGGARRCPEDWDHAVAAEQIRNFLYICGDAAAKNNFTVCIEALNRRETNMINSLPDAIGFAEEVNLPQIAVLADLYHMMLENEPMNVVSLAGSRLRHTHVADGEQRLAPGLGNFDFVAFYRALIYTGYGDNPDERCSIECRWQNFNAEAGPALDVLRKAWGEAVTFGQQPE